MMIFLLCDHQWCTLEWSNTLHKIASYVYVPFVQLMIFLLAVRVRIKPLLDKN